MANLFVRRNHSEHSARVLTSLMLRALNIQNPLSRQATAQILLPLPMVYSAGSDSRVVPFSDAEFKMLHPVWSSDHSSITFVKFERDRRPIGFGMYFNADFSPSGEMRPPLTRLIGCVSSVEYDPDTITKVARWEYQRSLDVQADFAALGIKLVHIVDHEVGPTLVREEDLTGEELVLPEEGS